jgi:hypothetical protein
MKTEKYNISTEYRELAEEVIREQEKLHWLSTVRIEYLACHEPKTSHERLVLGQCIKVQEIYQTYIPFDFFIVLYVPNIPKFTREQKKILLFHELLHIDYDITKEGDIRYKTAPHDIEDFRLILEKYGMDWSR